MRWPFLGTQGLLLLAFAGGPVACSTVNRQLNPPQVHWEDRKKNDTRAATFAQVMVTTNDAFERTLVPSSQPVNLPAEQLNTMDHDHDGYFVGVAISGGGSRSACFSAAVLFQLEQIGFMKHVDYMSTVSGGSLTAAYYCLNDNTVWNPGNVENKLVHSFATDLIVKMLLPWNTIALLASDLDRSDLMAESFRDVLFNRNGRELTFADLRADRPRLLMNATNMQSGRRFVFCNEEFDELNSDLSKYPIAYAVAASSAVPVAMHQVTLRNFSTQYTQYVHLIDGGIVDNLGVQSLVEVYRAHLSYAEERHLPDPYPKGCVLIVIDARVQYDAKLSNKSDTGLIDTIRSGTGLSSSTLLNRASNATLSDLILKNSPDDVTVKKLREEIEAFSKAGFLELEDRAGHRARVLHYAMSRVEDIGELPFQSFRESVNSIATYFNISAPEAFNLYQAADLLMRRKFKEKLGPIVKELDEAKK